MKDPETNDTAREQCCPHMNICRMIQVQEGTLPTLIDRFKANYCFNNHHVCARRWVYDFLGAKAVPELMMPQQRDWAEQLLFEADVSYTAFEKAYRLPLHRLGQK